MNFGEEIKQQLELKRYNDEELRHLTQNDLKQLQEEYNQLNELKDDDTYSRITDDIEFDLERFIIDQELEKRGENEIIPKSFTSMISKEDKNLNL